jgi:membrane protease YdiL (CAAX protease family)
MADLGLEAAAPSGAVSPLRRRPLPLVVYFTLAFGAAWAWWIGTAALAPSLSPTALGFLSLPGVFAPGIVAICLTARADGLAGVRTLLSGMLRWRVSARWYLFAIGYMAAVKLLAAVAYRLILGAWPAFSPVPWYALLAAVAFSTPFQAGEEIGWRGYALPRLASRLGLGPASVLLGVLWAAWHLPLFVSASDKTGQPFVPYLLSVTALSVAMAGLYWRSKGSLLLTMIMHAAINNTKDIVPSALPPSGHLLSMQAAVLTWLTIALLWVGAASFLVWMAGRTHTESATA